MNTRGDAVKNVKGLLAGIEPPELGPGPRPGVLSQAKLEAELKPILTDARLSSNSRELVRALVLLWHDHLHASHTLSQSIESSDGSLVHAIMHRRESDYWNSKYWWRRVGRHSCFPTIAERVSDQLKSEGDQTLAAKLLPRDEWDAFAFVDACQAAASLLPSDEHVQLLREIQRIETEAALEHFIG